MPMFRKKPVVVEAVNWIEMPRKEFEAWCPTATCHQDDSCRPYLKIKTLEGVMQADEGDWIIKGVKGEFYPCKPDIFAATYDAVPEPKPDDGIRRCGDCDAPIGECECN